MAAPVILKWFALWKLRPLGQEWKLGTTDDRESVSEPLEVTAVSRIHGTRRIHEVTGGHEEDRIRVQEELRGHHRTREDTAPRRFGTVRQFASYVVPGAGRGRPGG